MPIIRTPLVEGEQYLRARNDLIHNYDLSRDARIVLLDMLARQDDWEFDQERVGRQNGMGRNLTRKVFQELEDAGYLRQEPVRNGSRWGGVRWTVYDVAQGGEVQRRGGRFARTSQVTTFRSPDTRHLTVGEVTTFRSPESGDLSEATSVRRPETGRTSTNNQGSNDRGRTTEGRTTEQALAPAARAGDAAEPEPEEAEEQRSPLRYFDADLTPAPPPSGRKPRSQPRTRTPARADAAATTRLDDQGRAVNGGLLSKELLDAIREANPGIVLEDSYGPRYGSAFKRWLDKGVSAEVLRRAIELMVDAGYTDPKGIGGFVTRAQARPRANGQARPSSAPEITTYDPERKLTREHIRI